MYLVNNVESDSPQWIKIAQTTTQSSPSDTCTFINSVIKSIKTDAFSTPEGAEGYFIRSVDPEHKLFEAAKRPTILVIHGGPHSDSPKNRFLKSRLLWLSLGYNLCVVNYRGSIGYGLKQLEALSGHVFEHDIGDTLALFQQCIDSFPDEVDADRLGVYGGSHGGYLTCAAISHPEWKDRFKAACIWNPVTAMHSALLFSDIPDWHYSVALNREHTWLLEREDVLAMYDKSPISRLENVVTPSLFIIGGSDLRVPPNQGMYFWKGLKAKGVETEVCYYPDDGHAVSSTEQGIDAMMNMTRWWVDHF